jgi:hypothetical protein
MATTRRKGPGAAWKQTAIRRMDRTRTATLSFLKRLPEEAIVRPRTQGDWSIKDILAHIAAWEEEGAKRLALIRRGRAERVHFYDDMSEADRFNTRVVAAAARLSPRAMLSRLERARRHLVQELRKLPPSALRDPSHRYPVVGWLPEFAWTHEQGHLADIKAWWATQKASKRGGM